MNFVSNELLSLEGGRMQENLYHVINDNGKCEFSDNSALNE